MSEMKMFLCRDGVEITIASVLSSFSFNIFAAIQERVLLRQVSSLDFYGNCHILSEEDEGLRASRLALCAQTCVQLQIALEWLGIDVPERM